jgi:hypothetical protein
MNVRTVALLDDVAASNGRKPGGFTMIENEILRDPRFSPSAKAAYALIASFAYGAKTESYPSQETLAAMLGRSVRQVQTYLDELEGKKCVTCGRQYSGCEEHPDGPARLIECVRRGRGLSNVYRLDTQSAAYLDTQSASHLDTQSAAYEEDEVKKTSEEDKTFRSESPSVFQSVAEKSFSETDSPENGNEESNGNPVKDEEACDHDRSEGSEEKGSAAELIDVRAMKDDLIRRKIEEQRRRMPTRAA